MASFLIALSSKDLDPDISSLVLSFAFLFFILLYSAPANLHLHPPHLAPDPYPLQ